MFTQLCLCILISYQDRCGMACDAVASGGEMLQRTMAHQLPCEQQQQQQQQLVMLVVVMEGCVDARLAGLCLIDLGLVSSVVVQHEMVATGLSGLL